MCVSGTVTVVRCFLLVLVKTQTLPCNVLTRAGTRLRAGRARRVPPTDWQLLPALCSAACRLLQLSLAYLVGCGKLMWLDVATELNQPSALTSSFKWPFLFLFFSPFPPPLFWLKQDFCSPCSDPFFLKACEKVTYFWFSITTSCQAVVIGVGGTNLVDVNRRLWLLQCQTMPWLCWTHEVAQKVRIRITAMISLTK